jgi:hypothetical protein
METRKFCPIEEALLGIQTSAKNNRDLISALLFLQKVVVSMLTRPTDYKIKTLDDKENQQSVCQLFKWQEVLNFLKLLGFKEDGTCEHVFCDEEVKFLEAILKTLNAHIHSLKIAMVEEKPFFEIWKDNFYIRSPRTSNQTDFQIEPKNRYGKLQEMLSRHLKQDRLEGDVNYNRKRHDNFDASFNPEGYFHQSSQRADRKRKKIIF